MIGKFSRVKEINQLYCVGLLPHINDRSLSFNNPERSNTKTPETSDKKDKTLTLEKLKQRLRKQIDDLQSTSVGNFSNPLTPQKGSSKIANKTMDTSYISYNSRIHTTSDSPISSDQKRQSFFKRQTLYPHKIRSLTEQPKKQSVSKQKPMPMFSIKLLKNLVKYNQNLLKNDSFCPNIQTTPISKLRDSSELKNIFNSKNLQQMDMNITQIRINNQKFFNKNQEASKNLPCFIVKKSPQNPKELSRKRMFNRNPIIKAIIQKSYMSQRDHQPSDYPQTEMRKKYSEQISNDLIQLSTPRNYSLLRKSTRTEPSLSAWQ